MSSVDDTSDVSGDGGFGLLHPALQHHIVNTVGWRSLRPLQQATIAPILDGDHVLAMAPTAGGKTEAAIFPTISQLLSNDDRGLSVLYVCPLRALLNNLYLRLGEYAQMVGLSVGLWHGDIGPGRRNKMLAEPPDILLTTPESLEAMLVSTRVAHEQWFSNLRTVIVDEAHAFAGDDRGWHLLAVLARLSRLAGRELQRIALSATVGNPHEVLEWLTTGCQRSARVINPPAVSVAEPEITLDYVGTLDNAATVIARLHRGAKRLVFADSRARVEKLAASLRDLGVTTFVSHGSLGLEERRRAEEAFAEARDCVIVSTSTLELGIDVGDLDHVLQIDSTRSVASLLQRLGRSGRREGTTRNLTMLATSDDALLLGAGVLRRWSQGYVEPTVPPAAPMHLLGQQLLALTLQQGAIGEHTWVEWLGDPMALGELAAEHHREIIGHLIAGEYLTDTGGGMLVIGQTAEEQYGRRHFMELLAAFTAPPLFGVRHGRIEIGHVPDKVLTMRAPGADNGPSVLLLAGRRWAIVDIDWKRRIVRVEPTEFGGVARWPGDGGFLGAAIARGVREVLTGEGLGGVKLSSRAESHLKMLRSEFSWVRPDMTALVADGSAHRRWWTFAGTQANMWLAAALAPLRRSATNVEGLWLSLDSTATAADIREVLETTQWNEALLAPWVSGQAIDELKFSDTLPRDLAIKEVIERTRDDVSRDQVVSERIVDVTIAE